MVVYCEVANFVSQLNSKSLWETKLKYEVLLYTDSSDAALQVWQQKPTPVIDQCHGRRAIFHRQGGGAPAGSADRRISDEGQPRR